jgi:hypothetical protein
MCVGAFLLVGDLHVEGVSVQDAVEGIDLGEALAALAVVGAVYEAYGEAVVAPGGAFLGRGEGVLVALQAAAGVVAPDLLALADGFLPVVSIFDAVVTRCRGSFAPGMLLPGQEGKVRSGRLRAS